MKKSTARILTGKKNVTKHDLKALEFIELSLKSTDPASAQKCIDMTQELGAQATYTRLFKTFSYNDMHVLHYAACCANVVLTNNLVQFLGIDVNLRDNKGCTILHLAVQMNTPYYITYAVNVLHANINAVDKLGRMPIHYANVSQRPAAMQQLIDLGADTNSTIYYGKAVHIAASMGDVQALTALINKPDDVNYVIDSCINPLACAAYHGKLSSLTTLLEAGADVHISKLISKAIIADSPETLSMVNLLLQHNSNPNEFDASMNEDPPIIAAAKRGQGDVVILLVDQTDPIDGVNWNATAITEYVRSAAFKEEDKVRVATRVAALRERMMKGLRETNILVARVCCIALKHDMSLDEWDKCQNLCELFDRLCHEGTRPQLDDLYSYAMKFRGQKSKVKELMALKAILLFEPEDVNVQRKLSYIRSWLAFHP